MRSATASTSRSLWVMNTIDLPLSTRVRTTSKKSSTSPGVSTAVGSSRMRISASRSSALMSSTRCWTPDGQLADDGVGVDRAGRSGRRSRRCGPGWRRGRDGLGDVVSWPRATFSATVKVGISWKCWCTMPMPRAMASAELLEPDRLAPDDDLAAVRVGRARTARSSAWTCRRRSRRGGSGSRRLGRAKSTSWLAITPGKVLVIRRASSTGGGSSLDRHGGHLLTDANDPPAPWRPGGRSTGLVLALLRQAGDGIDADVERAGGERLAGLLELVEDLLGHVGVVRRGVGDATVLGVVSSNGPPANSPLSRRDDVVEHRRGRRA